MVNTENKTFISFFRSKIRQDNKGEETCLGNYGLACASPLALPESVTAVAFSPRTFPDGSYLLAAGMESGNLAFVRWSPEQKPDEWKVLRTLDSSSGHHGSVRRIRFSPETDSDLVATCSSDHSVKLFKLKPKL